MRITSYEIAISDKREIEDIINNMNMTINGWLSSVSNFNYSDSENNMILYQPLDGKLDVYLSKNNLHIIFDNTIKGAKLSKAYNDEYGYRIKIEADFDSGNNI